MTRRLFGTSVIWSVVTSLAIGVAIAAQPAIAKEANEDETGGREEGA